jgi:hypothetical protein
LQAGLLHLVRAHNLDQLLSLSRPTLTLVITT